MGSTEREFGPLDRLALENLVPADQFYRQLEKTLDLSFVPDLVWDAYASLYRHRLTRWSRPKINQDDGRSLT